MERIRTLADVLSVGGIIIFVLGLNYVPFETTSPFVTAGAVPYFKTAGWFLTGGWLLKRFTERLFPFGKRFFG
jgi:hypothetical protein